MNQYTSLDEFRSDLLAIQAISDAPDANSTTQIYLIFERVIGSEIELDAILLIANYMAQLNHESETWIFYQELIDRSSNKVDTPYVIAMSAAHRSDKLSPIIKYNITRLIYSCITNLILHSYIGHSNTRIGCVRVLLMIGANRDAYWVLRELRHFLSDDDEIANEFAFIANNQEFLEQLVGVGPASRLGIIASHILYMTGLWTDRRR